MKKNPANEPSSRTTTTGTTIAGIRVLVFVLDEVWAVAPELVALAAFAVSLPVAVVVGLAETVELKAPAADREASSAEFETINGNPDFCSYVLPSDTNVDVL